MSDYFMIDREDLQNFFNVVSGNVLYIVDNLNTLLHRDFSDANETLQFAAALIIIARELLEEINNFGNRHELIDKEGDEGQ